jgi:hypothetical protein
MAITSFTTTDAISQGNAVYLTSSGFLGKAIATNFTQSAVVGLALNSANSSNLVSVAGDSVFISSLTLTPGTLQYLSISSSGSLVDYPTWQTQFNSLVASGAFLTSVGRAVSSSGISLEIEKPIYVTK